MINYVLQWYLAALVVIRGNEENYLSRNQIKKMIFMPFYGLFWFFRKMYENNKNAL